MVSWYQWKTTETDGFVTENDDNMRHKREKDGGADDEEIDGDGDSDDDATMMMTEMNSGR